MGMYTELYLACNLKKDTPENILNWLKGDTETPFTQLKNTRLEKNNMKYSSYYFYAQPHQEITYDSISKSYHLLLLFNLKNYDNEIHKLLICVMPYIDAYEGEHLGHTRYEEDRIPTLIFKEKEN